MAFYRGVNKFCQGVFSLICIELSMQTKNWANLFAGTNKFASILPYILCPHNQSPFFLG